MYTLTAQTGSRVSPTRKVTSHSSGMEARNFMSSARPVLFSNVDQSTSLTSGSGVAKPGSGSTSGMAKTAVAAAIVRRFRH